MTGVPLNCENDCFYLLLSLLCNLHVPSLRTLATTIVDLDPDRHQGDPVVIKLKEASIGIAEMLTNYSDELYKFEQVRKYVDCIDLTHDW